MEQYGGISLYDADIEKIYKIDDEDIRFLNGYGYDLIGNPEHTDVTSTHQEYFPIHDDLFNIILATDQNTDVGLKVTPKILLLP